MNTTVETLDEQQHNYEYNVVLFYKYFPLTESEQVQFIDELKCRCEQNNMLGRILIAGEGMNGTLAGTFSSTNTFCEQISSFLLQRHGIINIDWKFSIDRGYEPPFLNLSIRQVKEIVGTGSTSEFLKSVIRYDASVFGGISNSGQHLNAHQFHNALSTANDNKIVLDIRNQFEYDIGHFEGSVNLATYTYSETFSALDKTLAARALEPSQPIYMYCTGGIRCEKASAYLSAKGYQNVFQVNNAFSDPTDPYCDRFLTAMCMYTCSCKAGSTATWKPSRTGASSSARTSCLMVACPWPRRCCPRRRPRRRSRRGSAAAGRWWGAALTASARATDTAGAMSGESHPVRRPIFPMSIVCF